MKGKGNDTPQSRNNWQESFTHQPQPKRVAPRMGGHQKNRGMKGMRKGSR